MGSIQKFCDAMRWAADSDQVGYSQSDRDSFTEFDFFNDGLYNTDCSKLVVVALRYAGFDTGWASYTGNMSAALCSNGWIRLSPYAALKPGDILLDDEDHAAVWLGDCIAQASIDENGNISGGERGDQSGWEVNTCGWYSNPWDCVLRYTGESDYGGGNASCEWQGDMIGLHDTTSNGDDYAGVPGRAIRNVAIDGVGEYQVSDLLHSDFWPKVDHYDLGDPENGYAGNNQPVDRLRIFDSSVSYQLHVLGGDWHAPMKGLVDTGGSSDDFAGEAGVQHDLLRVWRDDGEQPRYNVYS